MFNIKSILKSIIFIICDRVVRYSEQYRRESMYKEFNIDDTARLGNIELVGDIKIGANTYINTGSILSSGKYSKVTIGRHCAIGRYVSISAKTHSLKVPTSDEKYDVNLTEEADVTIGDYVWIGDKVFIRQGITIGNYSVIGANSVVLDNVKNFEIVAGIPAKHIRWNTEHYKYKEH